MRGARDKERVVAFTPWGGGGQRGARRTCGVAGPTDAGTSAPLFSGVAHTAPIVASRQPSGTFARANRELFFQKVSELFF